MENEGRGRAGHLRVQMDILEFVKETEQSRLDFQLGEPQHHSLRREAWTRATHFSGNVQ